MVWWKWNFQEINENTCAGAVSFYFLFLFLPLFHLLSTVYCCVYVECGMREQAKKSERVHGRVCKAYFMAKAHRWCLTPSFPLLMHFHNVFVCCLPRNLICWSSCAYVIQSKRGEREGDRACMCVWVSGFVFAVRIALVVFSSESLKLKREHLL